MSKFKVGDKIRYKGCRLWVGDDVITRIDHAGDPVTERYGAFYSDMLARMADIISSESEKSAKLPVKFILQYELDKDPFETFATMKEVEARIEELAKRPDLKRDSIKVYEIAKTYDVKLETRILFGGVKVKTTERVQPKTKKRGRPATLTEAQRKAKKRAYAREYYHRRKKAA